MNFYLAPLEGITGYIFRNAFNEFFGAGVDKYYTPFLALCPKKGITDRDRREVLPDNNKVKRLVPQVMTVSAVDFRKAKCMLREQGYEEININLGCPARTVTSKGRGSGALADLTKLESFLDEVYSDGDMNISIKTRIGVEQPDEFWKILEIYNKYPVKELTIHPRVMKELYRGTTHRDIFIEALGMAKMPVCYNGDINTIDDYIVLSELLQKASGGPVSGVMIGRGMLKDPAIIRKLHAFDLSAGASAGELNKLEATRDELLGFVLKLQHDYAEIFYGDTPVLHKMKELWAFLGPGLYPEQSKLLKKIMKSRSLSEYECIMRQILSIN